MTRTRVTRRPRGYRYRSSTAFCVSLGGCVRPVLGNNRLACQTFTTSHSFLRVNYPTETEKKKRKTTPLKKDDRKDEKVLIIWRGSRENDAMRDGSSRARDRHNALRSGDSDSERVCAHPTTTVPVDPTNRKVGMPTVLCHLHL